jgi:predicted RNase H-like HicB family nuclease
MCPEIKGCFTQGDSYEEATANLRDLVEATLKEELESEDIEEILASKTKIFSELEIVV